MKKCLLCLISALAMSQMVHANESRIVVGEKVTVRSIMGGLVMHQIITRATARKPSEVILVNPQSGRQIPDCKNGRYEIASDSALPLNPRDFKTVSILSFTCND